MTIEVEFFGIPRQRAGVASVCLCDLPEPTTIRAVLRELACRFPEFGSTCMDGDRLLPEFIANTDGCRFVSDPSTVLQDGECLLILSTDAGG